MHQLNGMDDIFIHIERGGLPMHVGSLAIYGPSASCSGPPDFAQIRESVRRGVLRAPVLRQRLVHTPLHLDRPYWIDAGDFDLDDHICRIRLPGPATWEQLRAAVSRFFEKPLDLERPLWRLAIIGNLDGIEGVPTGGFALVMQVHHALLDGMSGVDVMRAFHDASSDLTSSDSESAPQSESEPHATALLVRAWAHHLGRALGVAKLAANSLQSLARKARSSTISKTSTSETLPSAAVPRTRFNERPSSSRVFGGCRLELAEVQAIRSVVDGATVNDIILAICGGALHRYLDECNELPAEPLFAMAPISIRSADPTESGGNRVSMMAVALDTAIDDPLERLETVCRNARSSKKRSSDLGSNTMLDMANMVPSSLGELAVRTYRALGLSALHAPMFNCVVTNVPGPREPLFLAGSQMVANYGLGPIFDGIGLIHAVLSYCGGITITFTSCPNMLPDPDYYEACILDAFEELAAAAGLRDQEMPAVVGATA